MARYIDADKLIADGWVLERHGTSNKLLQVMSIADVPTADVVEAKHGEWISNEFGGVYVCSECGRKETTNIEPYCHCGAKMDGGKGESYDV